MGKRFVVVLLLLFLAAINASYVFGYLSSTGGTIFTGLIQNPLDGNSYLAKMYQGYQGDWKFHLPYSIERGQGAHLFLFYLFLGHLGRFFGLPLILVFHVARNLAAVLLFFSLANYIKKHFPLPAPSQRMALVLLLFGSGLGWIASMFYVVTSDFIVPEAFSFLSAYTNPHFPLALALIVLYLTDFYSDKPLLNVLARTLLGIILGIVLPFGIVVLAGIYLVLNLWLLASERKLAFPPLLGLLGGGICVLYQYFVILRDPVLAAWNIQNVTPAPPVWDVVLSLSPAFVLAFIGYKQAQRHLSRTAFRVLYGWAVLGLLLIYFPFNLQRRFMLGLFIPFSMLAVFGLMEISEAFKRNGKRIASLLVILSLLTNLFVIMVGFFGVLARSPDIFLSGAEKEGLAWIAGNTPEDSIILASKEMGRFIPAQTGRRVLYGHPLETIHAEEREEQVTRFFQGGMDRPALERFVNENGIEYILITAREGPQLQFESEMDYQVVYSNGDTRIYGTQNLQ